MRLISRLFPAFVECEETFSFPGQDVLFPAEQLQVIAASELRRAEFAAGRDCARKALARLGITPAPLLTGSDRVPLWPAGVIGTISHTRDYCAAAVCSSERAAGIGFDVEPQEPLSEDLIDVVCTPEERAWIRRDQSWCAGTLAKLVFSAKECAFKCQFPLTGRYLEFSDVTVSIETGSGQFAAHINGQPPLHGHFLISQGLIAAGILC